MDAAPHPLDMDIPNPVTPAEKVGPHGKFAQTMEVPQIDGEAEIRMVYPLKKPLKAGHGVDQHPRLGFKTQSLPKPGRVVG